MKLFFSESNKNIHNAWFFFFFFDLGQAQLERTQRKGTKQAVSIDLQNKT